MSVVEHMGELPSRMFLFWSMGEELCSRLIGRVDSVMHRGVRYGCPFSHVGLVFELGGRWSVVSESLMGKGVRLLPLDRLRASKRVSRYFLDELRVDERQIRSAWAATGRLTGSGYDGVHLLGLYLWLRFLGGRSGVRFLRRAVNDRYICSEWVDRVLGVAEVNAYERMPPQEATPHRLWYGRFGVPAVLREGSVHRRGALNRSDFVFEDKE